MSLEYDIPMIQDYLTTLFHLNDNQTLKEAGYVSFLYKWEELQQTKGKLTQATTYSMSLSSLKSKLADGSFISLLPSDKNIYIRGATYINHRGVVSNLKNIYEFYLDIDNHTHELSLAEAEEVLMYLEKHVFGTKLPMPTYSIYTGRGVHLHWFIQPLKDGQLTKWRYIETKFHTIMNQAYALYTLDETKVDWLHGTSVDSCKSPGHQLRLPTTFNFNCKQKTRSQVMAAYSNKKTYDVTALIQTYFKEDTYLTKEPTPNNSNRTAKPLTKAQLNALQTRHLARLRDLETLQTLRQDNYGPYREISCYRYKQTALFYTNGDLDESNRLTETYNSGFKVPLTKYELDTEVSSADTWWQTHKTHKPAKNITLIEELKITPTELKQLASITLERQSKEEKNLKLREKRRTNGLTTRQQAKADKIQVIQDLKKKQYSQSQIAEKLKLSVKTVQAYWNLDVTVYISSLSGNTRDNSERTYDEK